MHKPLIIFFLMLLLYNIEMKTIEIPCPKRCICDMVENLKRATCTNRNIYGIEIDMHSSADILDISYNYISKLESSIFQRLQLTELKLLNISNNRLGNNINIDAFNGMVELKTLDLSNNGIGTILNIWFKYMPNLLELYFSGNYLNGKLEDGLSSSSLEVMDLSNCGINDLKSNVFSKLPNLKHLDISKNHLHRLTVNVISPMTKLNHLNIDGNPMECNSLFRNTTKYITTQNITFITPCKNKVVNTKPTIEKFQKMVNHVSLERNSWIYEASDDGNSSVKIIEVCNTTSSKTHDTILLQIINVSPILIITFIFMYGILVGLAIACICGPVCLPSKFSKSISSNEDMEMADLSERMNSVNRRYKNRYSKIYNNSLGRNTSKSMASVFRRDNEFNDELMQSAWDIGQSSPMQVRRNLDYSKEYC